MAIENNTRACQKKFSKIYRELFSRCSFVVSAPGSFWWAGEYGVAYGSLAIQQKLPMRVYVGLEIIERAGIELGKTCFFIISKNKVKPWLDQDPIVSKIFDFLDQEFKISQQKIGLKIHAITEAPPGCGMNTSGAFAVALAAALQLKFNQLEIEDIKRWRKAKNKFDQTFRLAWKINSIFHADSSTGSTAFTPFITSSLPVLYFSEKRVGTLNNHRGARFPLDLQGKYQLIDSIPYWGISMEEFFQISSPVNYPIGFGLIYTGDSRQTGAVIRSLRTIKERLGDIFLMTKESFKNLSLKEDFVENCFLRLNRERKHRPGQNLWETYIDTISVIALEILYYFKEILLSGMSENTLRDFFKTVNRNQDLLKVIDTSFPTIDLICQYLHEFARQTNDEFGIGVKTTGAGKKGDVLFVCSDYSFRDCLDQVIAEMRALTKEDISLDYVSWIDGIEKEGVKIEQFLEKEIYSPFIAKVGIKIKNFSETGSVSSIYTLESLEQEKPRINLLIDAVNKEVFIKGKKMTSEELHSSTATIQILKALLIKPERSISNDQLPSSCYRGDRNELQSKIISPLTKAFYQITKKPFHFKVNGGLTKFQIELKLDGMNIWWIEKIL